MMADTGIGRILTTKVISPAQGYDRGIGNFQENAKHLGHERTVNVRQGVGEKGGDKQKSGQPTTVAVIEQWICLVLGLVCMAFGVWGICMEPGQNALSEHIAWLGLLYMPTLRVTAVVCVGLGVMLARRGWAHL
jgi:hypothetical protein